MMLLHDRATMAHALAVDLDPRLHVMLQAKVTALITADYDLTDYTEFLIIQPGDSEVDIMREVGFSPLTNPIDGARFGGAGFHPHWDWLGSHDGWFEMIVTFGSTFAYILLIQDDEHTLPDLVTLCRRYAGEAA